MKKLSLLAFAAAGLLITACSTSDAVSEVQDPITLDGKGQGFLSVNVNLPVRSSGFTRVDAEGKGDWQESTRLNDGDPNEYKVDDVLLVIFGGETEATATVQQLWTPNNLGTWGDVEDSPNQVTTRNKYVVKLEDDISGPYWVLAVINSHNLIKASSTAGKIEVNGTEVAFENCTLAKLQEAKVAADNGNGTTPFMNNTTAQDGFFMTNAVFSNQQGGHTNSDVKALVLAPVATIYESESAADAATAAPSADIYVERGLAKVTVSSSSLQFDSSVKTATGTAISTTPSLTGWVLDNTNKSSFLVRNFITDQASRAAQWGMFSRGTNAGIEKFRFVGYSNVDVPSAGNTSTTPAVYTQSTYRTYWSPDPNYAVTYSAGNFYEPATKTFPTDASKPQYCFENTFDVDHQNYKNTTRVVAKVKLNGGTTFYTLGSDRKTLYQEDDVRKALAARIINDQRFKDWATEKGYSVTEANFKSISFVDEATVAGTIHVDDITFASDPSGEGASFKTLDLTTAATVLSDAISAIGRVQQYPSGDTYYAIRIKHFGDDLTPWGWNGESEPTAEDNTDALKIAKIYPAGNETVGTADENYLGRYGVLRNNWYELSLDKILKIGHPIVPWLNPENSPKDPEDPTKPDPDNPNPEDPDHPDDSLDDSYISARINILSWAKRPQGVVLK